MEVRSAKVDHDALWAEHTKSDCTHEHTKIRKKKIKGGQIQIRRQCLKCGKSEGGALKRKEFSDEEFAQIPFWDSELESMHRIHRTEKYNQLRERYETEAQDVWDKSYGAYLKSKEWKAKRQQVLERDQFRCQGCLNARASQVHHLSYENLGDELLFQLISVCDSCHRRLHANNH